MANGFSVNDMKSKYSDFSRSYLFYCQIIHTGFNSNDSYLVNTATLPAESNEAIVTNWQGMEYKIGGPSTYSEFTVQFKADVAQNLRLKFIDWKRQIHNPITNVAGSPTSYFGTIHITQLNVQGAPIMSYKLYDAFPSAIGEVSLDYGSKEFSTFDVTFTYQYHDAVKENISAI